MDRFQVIPLVLDEDALLIGSHHASFVVGRGRDGLFSMQSSKIYASLMANPSSSRNNINVGHLNSVGKMMHGIKSCLIRITSTFAQSLEFQSRPVRVLTRLLLSPGGKCLCLHWHKVNRYKILHMDSLTSAVKRPLYKNNLDNSP